ncbi:polygalacturonase-like [Anoplophora glabripennis]|uniref:polygalacturonase-like n=1 Tax=Anoplophora glabripennis TaxID=217634 RepID=UPI000875905C|nr:polygalacturonase-like [Anoplophora glabripennis]
MSLYFSILCTTILSAFLATVHSTPHNVSATSCTITKYNADNILNAQKECSEIILKGLSVAAGKTLDLTHLQQGAKVTFEGTTTWEYKEWTGPLIKVSGTDVEITGSSDHVLDGRGSLWWDGLGGNGGKKKPKFITPVKMYNSKITNLNIKNSPVHVFSIKQCDGLTLDNVNIDDRDGDTQGGHNTDGFDIASSNNVVIKRSSVYSQDDCLAVKSGSNYEFTDNYCGGGHGISIGSVGDTTVESVYVSNCRVEDSANGVRIKTVYGAVGSVKKITFEAVTLKDITNYGIIIEGDYLNGGPTGTPTDGVPITDLTLKDISGTVLSSGTNVYVLVEAASDWHCSGIDVRGGENVKECQGIPSGSGLSC